MDSISNWCGLVPLLSMCAHNEKLTKKVCMLPFGACTSLNYMKFYQVSDYMKD